MDRHLQIMFWKPDSTPLQEFPLATEDGPNFIILDWRFRIIIVNIVVVGDVPI